MGDLVGFAYGEDLEEGSGRSLGYRLVAPLPPAPWCAEVEALARRLQAAPYPDHWPACDLFCSVLLADGRRLVGLARYGLADHTPGQRRGGLELTGVVGPAELDPSAALSLYRWLLQRRAGLDDLHRMGDGYRLEEVLASAPVAATGPVAGSDAGGHDPSGARPLAATEEGQAGSLSYGGGQARPLAATGGAPIPVLPVRLWQDGTFLFAAGSPGDPDHHLRLLDMVGTALWQWLPLVGPDFPLSTYAQRGPLVAWTPHLAGVALKLDRPEPVGAVAPLLRRSRRSRLLATFLMVVLCGLLAGNLWYMQQIHRAVTAPTPMPAAKEPSERALVLPLMGPPHREDNSRERFARALYQLLAEKGVREWQDDRAALLDRYEVLARRHRDLALAANNEQGQLAVAAAAVLAGRGTERIEESVRRALTGKGFSDRLIQAACEHVREQLTGEVKSRPGGP